MQALERSRERNLREARERARKRLQEEARQAARRLEAHQQWQSVHDRHQAAVGVEILREPKPNCYPHENNVLDRRMAEHLTGKVASLESRFEAPQEDQSQNKKTRRGFVSGTCDGEGIYEQLDETLMMNVN